MAMRRRDALETIGGLAGEATLGKFLPACSSDDDGPVGITTYVYSMLENHTPDHVFGARSWKEGNAIRTRSSETADKSPHLFSEDLRSSHDQYLWSIDAFLRKHQG